MVGRVSAISPTPVSSTHAKCDQNNVKQLKQTVQVYKVKGMVHKRNKEKVKTGPAKTRPARLLAMGMP